MAKTYYDSDADESLIQGRRVAIIGYGSQGHAHALNLRQSGVEVRVGLPNASASRAKAEAEGLHVLSSSEASRWAQTIMLLTPDPSQAGIYTESIEPHLEPGDTLMFAHGFNIRFGAIQPPSNVDVTMVAPKGPGHRVRETFVEGQGVPALLAVEQDTSGQAFAQALSYARALGATRAGVIATTFAEETETDLFGEQAVLCGGVSALVQSAFEILVKEGYQPEVAYFECLHELKLIVDLMYRGGLSYMRYSVSETAEYGDYVAGPRVINESVRAEMRKLLGQIRDGSFARKWIAECESGQERFKAQRIRSQGHPIEKIGAELRRRMPFLEPVEVTAEGILNGAGGEETTDAVPFF